MLLSSEVMELAQEYAQQLQRYGCHTADCDASPMDAAKDCACGFNKALRYSQAFLLDYPRQMRQRANRVKLIRVKTRRAFWWQFFLALLRPWESTRIEMER